MRFALLVMPLGGCFLNVGDDGTQVGTEVPDYCAESGRSVVDPDVVVDSLGFAPSEVIDGAAGTWTGAFTPISGPSSDATLVVQRAQGDVELVTFTMVMRVVEDGDTLSDGAPDAPVDCPSRLAIPIAATFATSDGAFEEGVTATMISTSSTDASYTAAVLLAEVVGTARPTSFAPDDWPYEALSVDAAFDGTWAGSLTWQGWTDEPTETMDTATGTGTIEPSGVSDGAGSFTVSR